MKWSRLRVELLALLALLGLQGTSSAADPPPTAAPPAAGGGPVPDRVREGSRSLPQQALLRLPRQRQAQGQPGARCLQGRARDPGESRGLGKRPRDGPDRRNAAQAAEAAAGGGDRGGARGARRRARPVRLHRAAQRGPGDDPPAQPGRVQQHDPRPGRASTSNPAADFPNDDVGYGFDNIGDVLSLSPLLLEKYLSAAETVLESGDRHCRPAQAGGEPPQQPSRVVRRRVDPTGGGGMFLSGQGRISARATSTKAIT